MKPNVQTILQTLKIDFVTQSSKAINVCCPFCGRIDTKYHCGVFVDNFRYHCFRCHKTGSLFSLLSKLTNISYGECKRLLKSPYDETETPKGKIMEILKGKTTEETVKSTGPFVFPNSIPIEPGMIDKYPLLKQFLQKRNISVETCLDYDAWYTGITGNYAYRILLPIWDDTSKDKEVSWQARDITGKAKTKYKSAPGSPINDFLYWSKYETGMPYQSGIPQYIVEGIFDVWRLGENAVATFGKAMSIRQKQLLLEDSPEKYVFAWDSDGYNEALKAARELAALRDGIGIVHLPEGHDPDSMGKKALLELPIRWIS